MPNVPAAGVVLSNDFKAMTTAFNKKGGSTSVARAISDNQNIFHFSNTNNSNLLSFKGGWGTYARTLGFELEIIDPTKDFEERFCKLNIPDQLVNSFSSFKGTNDIANIASIENSRIDHSFTPEQRTKLDEIIKQLRHLSSIQSLYNKAPLESGTEPDKSYYGHKLDQAAKNFKYGSPRSLQFDQDTGRATLGPNQFVGLIGEDQTSHPVYADTLAVFERAKQLDDNFKAKILEEKEKIDKENREIAAKNKIIDETNNLPKKMLLNRAADTFLKDGVKNNQFYLAFGLGDELRHWAGPFAVKLVGAELSISDDNLRVITLKFSYYNGVMALNGDEKPLHLDMQGYGIKVTGRSDLINLHQSVVNKQASEALKIFKGTKKENLFMRRDRDWETVSLHI